MIFGNSKRHSGQPRIAFDSESIEQFRSAITPNMAGFQTRLRLATPPLSQSCRRLSSQIAPLTNLCCHPGKEVKNAALNSPAALIAMLSLIKLLALLFVTWFLTLIGGAIFGLPLGLFLPEQISSTVAFAIGLIASCFLLRDSWKDLGEELGLIKKKVKPTPTPSPGDFQEKNED